jgi:hypothetical protein
MVGSSSMPQLDFPDRRRFEAGISARLLSELGIDKACLRSEAKKNLVPGYKHPSDRRTRFFTLFSMTYNHYSRELEESRSWL